MKSMACVLIGLLMHVSFVVNIEGMIVRLICRTKNDFILLCLSGKSIEQQFRDDARCMHAW